MPTNRRFILINTKKQSKIEHNATTHESIAKGLSNNNDLLFPLDDDICQHSTSSLLEPDDNSLNSTSIQDDDSNVTLDLEDNINTSFQSDNIPNIYPPTFQELMAIEHDPLTTQTEDFDYHIDSVDDDCHVEGNPVKESHNHPNPIPPNKDDRFSITDTAMIDLIQYCIKSGTSIKFFDEFFRLLKHHVSLGFDIEKAPNRANFLKKKEK